MLGWRCDDCFSQLHVLISLAIPLSFSCIKLTLPVKECPAGSVIDYYIIIIYMSSLASSLAPI